MSVRRTKNIVWEDLSVELPNIGGDAPITSKLLNGVTGFAESGRIMAVMGPSGSGKTTLLDSLAGRLAANVKMSGNILINGKNRSMHSRKVSYVTQEELLLGTLTVRETLTYSARMRLPSKMSNEGIKKVVEGTIMEMGLEECGDNKIGNWHLRGISNGEKKRLSIGIEILTQPDVLFLDEPSTGLDSASAFYVILALTNIAHKAKIVICSIHQPSSEIFRLFDDLLLLSGGETVYFGKANLALKLMGSRDQFFADAGFPCPSRRNPSDHFLLCINPDFDSTNVNAALIKSQPTASTSSKSANFMTTEEIRATLIQSYKNSQLMIRASIQKVEANEEQLTESKPKSSRGWWRQLWTLTKRSSLNMTRDMGYYWLRIIFYTLISISLGTLFFHVGTDNSSILARAKSVSFIDGFMICLSCGGLPSFIEELRVFYGERSKGHYGEDVFVLSNTLSSFPFLVVIALLSGTIIYHMVQFHPGFTNYAFFCINLFCYLAVVESCVMVVASLVPNVLMGIGTATGVIIFMMMSSQIFRPLRDIPKFFWRYPMSYISFATWAVQGQYKNDMLGLEFEPLIPGDPKVKGEQVLRLVIGVPLDHAKWLDLAALTTLLLLHRLLLFLVLRYNNRPKSSLFWFKARATLLHFAVRFSPFNKNSLSSKKQRPPHSLSSQEDLVSPNVAKY